MSKTEDGDVLDQTAIAYKKGKEFGENLIKSIEEYLKNKEDLKKELQKFNNLSERKS